MTLHDPLWAPERPLRLPGASRPRNPVHRVARTLLALVCGGLIGAWLVAWWTDDPGVDVCIGLPDGSAYPVLDFRGLDGAWLFNGHVLGYSQTEDVNSCLSPTPLR